MELKGISRCFTHIRSYL